MQHGLRAVWPEREDGATAIGAAVIAATALRRAVEVARVIDDQPGGGIPSVTSADETVEQLEPSAVRAFEHCPIIVDAAELGHAVEVPCAIHRQSGIGWKSAIFG